MTPAELEELLRDLEHAAQWANSIHAATATKAIQTIRDQQARINDQSALIEIQHVTLEAAKEEIKVLQAEIERLRGEKKELLVKLYANSFTSDHD